MLTVSSHSESPALVEADFPRGQSRQCQLFWKCLVCLCHLLPPTFPLSGDTSCLALMRPQKSRGRTVLSTKRLIKIFLRAGCHRPCFFPGSFGPGGFLGLSSDAHSGLMLPQSQGGPCGEGGPETPFCSVSGWDSENKSPPQGVPSG